MISSFINADTWLWIYFIWEELFKVPNYLFCDKSIPIHHRVQFEDRGEYSLELIVSRSHLLGALSCHRVNQVGSCRLYGFRQQYLLGSFHRHRSQSQTSLPKAQSTLNHFIFYTQLKIIIIGLLVYLFSVKLTIHLRVFLI